MKKTLLAIALTLATYTAYGSDLIEVYKQALESDPTFQAAIAQQASTHQGVPIARAFLLPNANAFGYDQYNRFDNQSEGNNNIPLPNGQTITLQGNQGIFNYNSNGYTIQAAQPLFDYAAWAGLSQAQYTSKSADSTFNAAVQDLIQRTSAAYFAVLNAEDQLTYTQAEKQATYENLTVSQEQFKVGLIAITSVYNAQAQYDLIVAQEISDKTAIVNAKENLRAITGVYYDNLASLKNNKVPLTKPVPMDENAWVAIALKQNWTLSAARLTAQASHQQINIEEAGHLPTVDAVTSFTGAKTGDTPQGKVNTRDGFAGVQVNLPIFQNGVGFVTASTKQAEYNYDVSVDDMHTTERNTVNVTRQSYNNVTTQISKINADEKAIESNQSSLQSTIEGYKVGTQTMLDVLQAQQDLFDAWSQYSTDQYSYIDNTIVLKQAAGTLSPRDLQEINMWLTEKRTPFTTFDATAINRGPLGGGNTKSNKK